MHTADLDALDKPHMSGPRSPSRLQQGRPAPRRIQELSSYLKA